jgi:hypothetical protein
VISFWTSVLIWCGGKFLNSLSHCSLWLVTFIAELHSCGIVVKGRSCRLCSLQLIDRHCMFLQYYAVWRSRSFYTEYLWRLSWNEIAWLHGWRPLVYVAGECWNQCTVQAQLFCLFWWNLLFSSMSIVDFSFIFTIVCVTLCFDVSSIIAKYSFLPMTYSTMKIEELGIK